MSTNDTNTTRRVPPIRVVLGETADPGVLSGAFASVGNLDVVGLGHDGVRVVRLNRMLQPDVVLMDLRLPVMDGIRATRCMIEARMPAKILVYGTEDDACLAPIARNAVADGFLVTTSLLADVVSTMRSVVRLPERTYTDPWAAMA